MSMRRLLTGLGLISILVILVWMNRDREKNITLSGATITKMADGSMMASVKITNAGPPDVLENVQVVGFSHSRIKGGSSQIVIPGGSTPSLSADGAHIMLTDGAREVENGELIPINLQFRNSGKVSVRAKVTGMTMDHRISNGQQANGINVDLSLQKSDQLGVFGVIDLQGIELVLVAENAEHVQGQGHGHLYLNGLKLQRVFEREFSIGPLLPGEYTVSLTINTNDHRAYMTDGQIVGDQLAFEVE